MNLNDNPEELKKEEQVILDNLITDMDQVISKLDQKMKVYVNEAKNEDISVNPDSYLAHVLAQKGKKDTKENRKKFLQSRDELYKTRLLLQYKEGKSEGIYEIKVGLHSCNYGVQNFVTSWKIPLCRHYLLDNASTEFKSVVTGKRGEKYYTDYTLLVKNQVNLRFTRVAKALNLAPGAIDAELLGKIKGTGFFSDEFLNKLIQKFDPEKYDPDSAAKIISDEFLQELLERRTTPEFKNIVFSIQKNREK